MFPVAPDGVDSHYDYRYYGCYSEGIYWIAILNPSMYKVKIKVDPQVYVTLMTKTL